MKIKCLLTALLFLGLFATQHAFGTCPEGQFICAGGTSESTPCCDIEKSKCAFVETNTQNNLVCQECPATSPYGCNTKCCSTKQYCQDFEKSRCASRFQCGENWCLPEVQACINDQCVTICSGTEQPMCGSTCCASNQRCTSDNQCETCPEGTIACGGSCCSSGQMCIAGSCST